MTNKTQKLNLYLSKDNPGDHKIFNNDEDDNRQSIEVEAIRLDDYFEDSHPKINLIKMDVQGAKYNVIKGVLNLLNKNNKTKIFTEYWPARLKSAGKNPEEFLTCLFKLGFKLYNIDEQKRKVEPVIISKLEKHFRSGDNQTNLLCVK